MLRINCTLVGEGRPRTFIGSLSLSHEPQMTMFVMNPGVVHNQSSARTYGGVGGLGSFASDVAFTSIPLVLKSGSCSHFELAVVIVPLLTSSNARSHALV